MLVDIPYICLGSEWHGYRSPVATFLGHRFSSFADVEAVCLSKTWQRWHFFLPPIPVESVESGDVYILDSSFALQIV